MQNQLAAILGLLLALAACDSSIYGDDNGVQPIYDDNTAFVLVGQEVPAGKLDYYLFDFNLGLTVEENTAELQEGLRQNPLGSAYMGIVGPDAKHNLAVIKQLMQQQKDATYPDKTIIYIGPARNENTVRELLAPLKAHVRYVVYP